MKRKLLFSITSFACALSCAFSMAACTPSYSDEPETELPPPNAPSADVDYDHPLQERGNTNLAFELNVGGESYSVTGMGKAVGTILNIPNTYKGLPVNRIADDAFNGQELLTTVTLPESILTIGQGAFSGCKRIISIKIPNSVTSVGELAFSACSGLVGVVIGNSMDSIPSKAFQGCSSLMTIDIPSNIESVGEYAFQSCDALTTVTIRQGVQSIGKGAFNYCPHIKSLIIEDGLQTIDDDAFRGLTELRSLELPKSIVSIGLGAFEDCTNLEKITIPFAGNLNPEYAEGHNVPKKSAHFGYIFGCPSNENENVGDAYADQGSYFPKNLKTLVFTGDRPSMEFMFNDAPFETIIIKGKLDSMPASMFFGCWNIKSIVIPTSVKSMGNQVIMTGDNNFNKLYYEGSSLEWTRIRIGPDNNTAIKNVTKFWYSSDNPFVNGVTSGNFWHYGDNGEIIEWQYQPEVES